MGPSAMRVILALVGVLGAVVLPPSLHAGTLQCERAILDASGAMVRETMVDLRRCAAGGTPVATCLASVSIATGELAKLVRGVERSCGGNDAHCDAAGTGTAADVPLASFGWAIDRCPDFEGLGCTNAIDDCGDIPECIRCLSNAAVGQAVDLAHGSLTPSPGFDLRQCQRSLSAEMARLFRVTSKALQKCEGRVRRGVIPGPCPDADVAAPMIAAARDRLMLGICRNCGGDDRVCGGFDDFSPAMIGFPSRCPAATPRGGPSCEGPVSTVAQLASCLGCVTETAAGCLDAAASLGNAPYPEECRVPSGCSAAAEDMNTQRCTGDTSVRCASAPGGVAGCGGLGTCEFYFGSSVPLAAGGISVCVTSQWNGSISGTANPETGASAGTANLIWTVHGGETIDRPCPQCTGDQTPNDGVNGGTCTGGARNGLPCDGNGVAVNPTFGVTSMDCPPQGISLIGTLPINVDNTNAGTKSVTLVAASPNCKGKPGAKCPCDVCSANQTKPCRSNADCLGGEGTCGGVLVGQPSKPNTCIDDTNQPGDGSFCIDTDPLGDGEGECLDGPMDGTCAVQTHRACTIATEATDCPLAGDSCQLANRKCFAGMNGVIGNTIAAQGSHDSPVDNEARATFASMFCIPPTVSAAVNFVVGLPGPGRLELDGLAAGNGTGATCPTELSFTVLRPHTALDPGFTGMAHEAPLTCGTKVTVAATCPGGPPPAPCGDCVYSGPIPNPNAVP